MERQTLLASIPDQLEERPFSELRIRLFPIPEQLDPESATTDTTGNNGGNERSNPLGPWKERGPGRRNSNSSRGWTVLIFLGLG